MASYALTLPAPVQVALTLPGKHPAGMLLIMANLKVVNAIVDARQQLTALALVSTAQNLTAVALNPVAGVVLDTQGYQAMLSLGLVGVAVAFAMALAFRVKDGNGSGLFS